MNDQLCILDIETTGFEPENSEILEQVENPVTLIHGHGKKLLPKIEEALLGKKTGDMVDITVNPNEGFGEYDKSMIIKDKVSNVPEPVSYTHLTLPTIYSV